MLEELLDRAAVVEARGCCHRVPRGGSPCSDPARASPYPAFYRPAERRHIRSRYDHRLLRLPTEAPTESQARRGEFPSARIVSARPPRKRHYGEIRDGIPDEAQRAELIRQFMHRTLKGTPE